MITFVATATHQYAIRDVLETRTHPLHSRIVILSYNEFVASRRLPQSTYVFTDLERLSVADRKLVDARIEAFGQACPDCRMLNLPMRIGTRLDIMRRLHESGINKFRMLPITTDPETFRYPVFLRCDDDHEGPKSDLLHSSKELRDAIAALPRDDRQNSRFVVTEYVDARNANGFHEKRSYTRVGSRLFPSALDQSKAWVCKGEYTDPATVPIPDRELAFLKSDMDEAALRAAFSAAGIEYGRADYALVDGRPQIFEINTNPWIEPPEQVPGEARAGAEHIVSAWLEAVSELADEASGTSNAWREIPCAAGRLPRGLSRRSAAHAVLRGLRQLHNETRAFRWLRRLRLM
ncbi:MAG: hypothetical protein FJX25_05785 [Alphaproteobacteria bacterium]|nr:hypothetical protein [Alphaproteobacteria bacterium]